MQRPYIGQPNTPGRCGRLNCHNPEPHTHNHTTLQWIALLLTSIIVILLVLVWRAFA